jgi:hypothetical protein
MKRLILGFLVICVGILSAQTLDDYIKGQCEEVGLPVRVAYAILLQENDALYAGAVHENLNGTVDLGLWQLNSAYLYTDFVPRYWNSGAASFRWDDPYHSTYVAVRHIKWLWDLCPGRIPLQSKVFTVALSYKCGRGALESGNISEDSVAYATRVVGYVWGGN